MVSIPSREALMYRYTRTHWEFGRSYQSSNLPRPQIRVGEQEPRSLYLTRGG
jgi:hypothetical protein